MHSDIHESIWVKLGIMIVAVELYILMLILLTLTFIQGHRSAKKQKPLHQLSHKVFSWFEWNYGDLFVWWTSYSFDLIQMISSIEY